MKTVGTFPTGESIKEVKQVDRKPKRVFVLGVYASAVHARWTDSTGKPRITAMAVASEPEIFWTGDGAKEIIGKITPPNKDGRLEDAGDMYNGPSGKALDNLILAPYDLKRTATWLCDLRPQSYMNPNQEAALIREGLIPKGLKDPPWPRVPKCLADEERRAEILTELNESQATVLVTLGDKPLEFFAAYFGARRHLADYGKDANTYGQLHPLRLPDRCIHLLPIAHSRQIAGLGNHSSEWAALHKNWAEKTKPHLPL